MGDFNMNKHSMRIKSHYGKSKCLGEWEDTEFTFILEAPFWLTKAVKKVIIKYLTEEKKKRI